MQQRAAQPVLIAPPPPPPKARAAEASQPSPQRSSPRPRLPQSRQSTRAAEQLEQQALPALVMGLMAVDLGVQGSFVANQARIYSIDPSARSRMSSQLFLSCYLGAAICSTLIALFWIQWGWAGTCMFAITLMGLAIIVERPTWQPRRIG